MDCPHMRHIAAVSGKLQLSDKVRIKCKLRTLQTQKGRQGLCIMDRDTWYIHCALKASVVVLRFHERKFRCVCSLGVYRL